MSCNKIEDDGVSNLGLALSCCNNLTSLILGLTQIFSRIYMINFANKYAYY
ncbi:hypothetical protein ABPG74_017700 [Tetrahymena malaccensis]